MAVDSHAFLYTIPIIYKCKINNNLINGFVRESQAIKNNFMTMKKILSLSQLLIAMLVLFSCGSSQKVPQALKSEMENPYGKELFKTEAELYAEAMPGKRAYGKGVSASESAARQLAELDARAQFSRSVDAAIVSASKVVGFDITQYAGGDNEGMNSTDAGQQQNTLSKSISNNIIASTTIVKQNKYYGKDRKYTIFVCLEYNGSVADIAKKATQQIMQRISDSDREKIQNENGKFEQEVENSLLGK